MQLSEFFDQLYETHNSTSALDLCCQYIKNLDSQELTALEALSRMRCSDNRLEYTSISGKAIRKASQKLLPWSISVITKSYKLEGNPGAAFARMLDIANQGNREMTPVIMLNSVKKLDSISANQQVGFILELVRDFNIKSVEWFLRLFGPGEGVAFDQPLFIKALSINWNTSEIQVSNIIRTSKLISFTELNQANSITPVFGRYFPQPTFTSAINSEIPNDTYIVLNEPPGVPVQYHHSRDRQLIYLADGTDITGVFPEFEIELKIAGNAILFGYIVPQDLGNQSVQEWFDRRLQLPQMDMFARFEAPCALCLYDAVMLNGIEITQTDYNHRLIKLRQHQFVEPLFKLKYDIWQSQHDESQNSKGALILINKSALLHPNVKSNDYIRISPYRFRATVVEASTEFGRENDQMTQVTLALQDSAGRFIRVGSTSIKHLSFQMLEELNTLFESKTIKRRANSRILDPSVVFEVDCDGFAQSNRHISKTILYQPKIVRWLRGISVTNIDNIDKLVLNVQTRK